MLENYNINDYLKDDKELQKAVIQELLEDFQCAVMNVENLLETKQRLKEEKGGMQILIDNYIALTQKYHQTLQEIKAIAEEIADTGNWLNCGYNASRAKKILDLITKAEEE